MTKKMPIGEFKLKCLMVIDKVKKNGQPITITKQGKPLVTIVPGAERDFESDCSPFGIMAGTAKINGDIIGSLAQW